MKIIDRSLVGSDYSFEYFMLTILSIVTFKRIEKVESKRAKLKEKMKENANRV